MALSTRERRLIAVAGALFLVLVVFFLLRRGDVEPAPLAPLPQQQPPLAAPAPAPPAAPVPDASGLRLHGLLASGAIIAFADGSQRLVPIGRDVLPGLRLARIEQMHAVLSSPAGEIRLGFDGVAQPQAGQATVSAASTAEAGQRDETLRYRIGLEPRRTEGRVTGFTMRPGADLPALQRAGIRPGDTILSVNGSLLNEEQLQELAWTIANSTRTEFEVERGGRRMRMAVQGR
jgi:general secretion pathway protein C